VIYCQDGRRRRQQPHMSFTFLGSSSGSAGTRTRSAEMLSGFNPAASKDAPKKTSEQVRTWRPFLGTDPSESDIARRLAAHAWLGGGNLR
jgi:RNA-directed DNA polymerase